ncbi:hypothetical protein [Nakamurella deserti]|uniref:hypothetical protein n=1 Tax=Nakamurella deserti TaxID=2164074 RepID=UPI000DBE1D51|nr:hypothetical protein [Nakamurella deserti]
MSTTAHTRSDSIDVAPAHHHMSTETKASSKTSELYVYVALVVAIIVTAMVVGDENSNGVDPFGALDAIRYITYATIGYLVARGLAKSGSRDNHHG